METCEVGVILEFKRRVKPFAGGDRKSLAIFFECQTFNLCLKVPSRVTYTYRYVWIFVLEHHIIFIICPCQMFVWI